MTEVMEHHEKWFKKLAKDWGSPEQIAGRVTSSYHLQTRDDYHLNEQGAEQEYERGITQGIILIRGGEKYVVVSDNAGIRDFMCDHCRLKDNPTQGICYHYHG